MDFEGDIEVDEECESSSIEKEKTLDDFIGEFHGIVDTLSQKKTELETCRNELQTRLKAVKEEIDNVDQELQRAKEADKALNKIGLKPPRNSHVKIHCHEVALTLSKGSCATNITDKGFIIRMQKLYPSVGVASISSALYKLDREGVIERKGPKGSRTGFVVLKDREGKNLPGDDNQFTLSWDLPRYHLTGKEEAVKTRLMLVLMEAYPKKTRRIDLIWEGQDTNIVNEVLKTMIKHNEVEEFKEDDSCRLTTEYKRYLDDHNMF